MNLFEWTKRLGHQCWSIPGSGTGQTLCGRPMLGNNYAKHIDDKDKKPCDKCREIIEGMASHGEA